MGDVGRHQQSVIRRRTRHDAYDPPPAVADSSQQQHLTSSAAVRLYDSARESSGVDRQIAVTSTLHGYEHLQPKAAAAAASQPTPPIYPSVYCPPSHQHAGTSPPADDDDDVDDVEEDFTVAAVTQQFLAAAAATDVRPYFRGACAPAAGQRHVTTAAGNHVTGYTSVIVDTQQLHANGYVH